MAMLLVSKTDKNILSDAYIICNTPRSLYNTFRSNSIVPGIAGGCGAKEIIEMFLKIGEDGIDSVEELAYAYALYVALTFKEYDDAFRFYSDKGNINFEWFPDLKNIYLSSYRHTNQYSLSAGDFEVNAAYSVDRSDFAGNKQWDNHVISF